MYQESNYKELMIYLIKMHKETASSTLLINRIENNITREGALNENELI